MINSLFDRKQAKQFDTIARVYLKTPNAPGQRAFLRCAASFFLEIRQYSCEKMSCATQKSLAAGHIMSFQIHPKEKAKLHKKELSAVEDFMSSNSMETIVKVLDVVDANGHPTEKAISLELREKYTNYELEFDDIMTLETLYKSNYRYFKNKDENDE